jgi:hypothetical protein
MYSEIISTPALKSYKTIPSASLGTRSLSIFKDPSLFDIPICPSGIFPKIGKEKQGNGKWISFIKSFIEAVPKALNYGIYTKVLQTFLSAVVQTRMSVLQRKTMIRTPLIYLDNHLGLIWINPLQKGVPACRSGRKTPKFCFFALTPALKDRVSDFQSLAKSLILTPSFMAGS